MEKLKVDSWDGLIAILNDLKTLYSSHKIEEYEGQNLILYRGQADSDWPLRTTLERRSSKLWSLNSYFEMIYFLAPEIESFLGASWHLPKLSDFEREREATFRPYLVEIPHYEYWAYLRHNGFPSPFLDWSKSAYVALFFAITDSADASRGSIFVYIERPTGGKGGIVGGPQITVMHPYVKTHRRHFLQQSHYTIATRSDEEHKDYDFVPHDTIFNEARTDQDLLFKIDFPKSIRAKALEALNDYNITHFSLFQSEESLIKSLEVRTFDC